MTRASVTDRGFTLLEVVVALAIAGLLLAGAAGIVTRLSDHADRVVQVSADADRQGNADALLRALVLRLELSANAAEGFAGTEQFADFMSWCDRPQGWQERCAVRIAFDSVGGRLMLTLDVDGAGPLVLRSEFSRGELRYLASAEDGGRWYRAWRRGISSPLAIGVILDADTLILRIGERG